MSKFNPSDWQGYGRLKQVDYIDKPEKTELTDHEMLVAIYNKLFEKSAD